MVWARQALGQSDFILEGDKDADDDCSKADVNCVYASEVNVRGYLHRFDEFEALAAPAPFPHGAEKARTPWTKRIFFGVVHRHPGGL